MTTSHRRIKSGDMMIAAARIKAEAIGKGGDPSAGSEIAESATTALSPPPQISIGSEIVPVEALGFPAPELCNTLENPSLITADASVARLHLLDRVGVLEMGLDAAETIRPQNSLEMMLAHQLAALHWSTMKVADQLNKTVVFAAGNDGHNVGAVRLAGALARGCTTFQQGLLTIRQLRSGGKQDVTVTHVHQQVSVSDGGQAIVAGEMKSPRTKRRRSRQTARPTYPTLRSRGSDEKEGQPDATDNAGAFAFAPGTPLRGTDPSGVPVLVPSCEGKAEVPDEWRVEGKRRSERGT
jgi:hypothetical protein